MDHDTSCCGWTEELAGANLIREGRIEGEDPAFREQAQSWLAAYPSGWREVDELWHECLQGKGRLAAWLASGSDPSEWRGFPSLHSVLASHPFPNLLSWSIQSRSRAS